MAPPITRRPLSPGVRIPLVDGHWPLDDPLVALILFPCPPRGTLDGPLVALVLIPGPKVAP